MELIGAAGNSFNMPLLGTRFPQQIRIEGYKPTPKLTVSARMAGSSAPLIRQLIGHFVATIRQLKFVPRARKTPYVEFARF